MTSHPPSSQKPGTPPPHGIGGNGESVFPLYKDRTAALQDLEKRWTKQILENAGERLINPYLAWTREEPQEALNEYLEEQADD